MTSGNASGAASLSGAGPDGRTDRWLVPAAARPVRSRVWLPAEIAESGTTAAVLAASMFTAAAVVTGGTVLIRNWPAGPVELTAAVRSLFADAGAYVVRSADGLTVTSRATSGELRSVTGNLGAVPDLIPLAAVLAARAPGRSELRVGDAGALAARTAGNLRSVGVSAESAAGVLTIDGTTPRAGSWDGSPSPALTAAGLVLGLVVPGLDVTGVRALRRALPGIERQWLQLLSADEYLLPGSARLPHDYL